MRNMRQSPVLCLAAVGTVAVALALLAFFAITVLNVQQLTASWSEEMTVVVYLDEEPDRKELKKWRQEIQAYAEVDKVGFVSQEEALKRFQMRLGDDAALLEGLDANILPASLEVQLSPEHQNRAGVSSVVERLRQKKQFTDLQYGQDWLDKFEAFLLLLRTAGVALGSFLIFAALVIVANTIKLTLYARQDELEAMAMVGGTSLFIKLPYLVEGAIQGILGGLVALGVSFLVFHVLLQESLGSLLLITGVESIHFLPLYWQLILVGSGGVIGLLGSLFALRKFVRIGPV
jgi:cell division transport system permease protein